MERVGDCSSEDKTSGLVFCLAVLNATTIHQHGFNCILSLVGVPISRFKKQWRNEILKCMHKEFPVEQKSGYLFML